MAAESSENSDNGLIDLQVPSFSPIGVKVVVFRAEIQTIAHFLCAKGSNVISKFTIS